MLAVHQRELGGPEVLEIVELPRPEPRPTEVLVRVRAAGVNPLDWKTRSHGVFLGAPPFTLGAEAAGVVAALGSGVTRFSVGDRVFGMPRFPDGARAYAEYLTSPSRQLAATPDGLSDVEAAALPLAGLTAWQALVETADVRPGDRVLVHAAAGGVGHLAVQIAKARGAYVIGTARATNHGFLAELGADECIDYTQVDFAECVQDVDVVLDAAGGDTAVRSLPTIRNGGRLVCVTSGFEAASDAAGDRVRVEYMLVEPDRCGLEALVALVENGAVRVDVGASFPLNEVRQAHAVGESGRTRGKLVLTID